MKFNGNETFKLNWNTILTSNLSPSEKVNLHAQ